MSPPRHIFQIFLLLLLLPSLCLSHPSIHLLNLTHQTLGQNTFDTCTPTSTCTAPRTCIARPKILSDDQKPCTASDPDCICAPPRFQQCITQSECPQSESCAALDPPFAAICVSTQAAARGPIFTILTDPNPDGGRLTGDHCLYNKNCRAPRACLDIVSSRQIQFCIGRFSFCVCEPPVLHHCDTNKDCVRGEICLALASGSFQGNGGLCRSRREGNIAFSPVPARQSQVGVRDPDDVVPFSSSSPPASASGRAVSPTSNVKPSATSKVAPSPTSKVAPSPTSKVAPSSTSKAAPSATPKVAISVPTISRTPGPTKTAEPTISAAETEVCIAVRHLHHLNAHQRVYPIDKLAWVLCDKWGSCATAGHLVAFHGTSMVMKTYCTLVDGGCKRIVERVNSPRAWAARIESNSKGLRFTSLAARWGTKIEERVLSVLVRVAL